MADVRTLWWSGDSLVLLNQTLLPWEERDVSCKDVNSLVESIQNLVVRGAPALGAVGAYGVALALIQQAREGWDSDRLHAEIVRIREARPTAVNLAWGVDRALTAVPGGLPAVLGVAEDIVAEDDRANRILSSIGADYVMSRLDRRPLRILTHCNAGSLATTGWGTALGIVRELHKRDAVELVYVDETRPLLQGARLTSWELSRYGIRHVVQIDSAASSTILRGLVDFAVIGADRIALNGDTANKIGSVGIALACHYVGVPFIVAAPTSTIDSSIETGVDIPIEYRDPDEVLMHRDWDGRGSTVEGANPAFDVTPASLISAIVTEQGLFEPDGGTSIRSLLGTEHV